MGREGKGRVRRRHGRGRRGGEGKKGGDPRVYL